MRILMGAKPCGFGPVSKLLALARQLQGETLHFAGDAIALDFVRRNPGPFAVVEPVDAARADQLAGAIAAADCAVVVMDEDLAFWSSLAGLPVFFVDSLLAFWRLDHDFDQLHAIAMELRRLPPAGARARFEGLTVHERKVIAHLLATRSYAQGFPGVHERVEALRAAGCGHVAVCGPVVDHEGLREAAAGAPAGDAWDVVVGLGGFQNFYLDFTSHDAYLRLLERWAVDHAGGHGRGWRMLMCCGAYDPPRRTETRTGAAVERRCLPHRAFLRAVAAAGTYLSTPGLTALYEGVLLDQLPLLLPEEHYGHVANVAGLSGTLAGRSALRLQDVVAGYAVPDDDLAGTRAIVELTERLLASESGYRRFRRALDRRVEDFRALPEAARRRGLDELRAGLAGVGPGEMVADIRATARAAGRSA